MFVYCMDIQYSESFAGAQPRKANSFEVAFKTQKSPASVGILDI